MRNGSAAALLRFPPRQAAPAVAIPLTVTVVSADGTTLAPAASPAIGDIGPAAAPTAASGIHTAEGIWTFGTPPDAGGDYPLLVNGVQSGWGVLLQVTNGNL